MAQKATKVKKRKYLPGEISEIGEKIYQDSLKDKLEPRLNGKFVVIDIITGHYLIGDDQYANHKLSLKLLAPNPRYGRKIGPDPDCASFG